MKWHAPHTTKKEIEMARADQKSINQTANESNEKFSTFQTQLSVITAMSIEYDFATMAYELEIALTSNKDSVSERNFSDFEGFVTTADVDRPPISSLQASSTAHAQNLSLRCSQVPRQSRRSRTLQDAE